MTTIPNGCDFDDFAGIEYRRGERFTITHAGSFFGRRDPRPFLQALADSKLDAVARFVGDFRPADREWADALGLGDRLELVPYTSHQHALELQRSSDALLLLIPEADGRGRGVLSGKVFEYLAAERPILAVVPPDGAAAELIREVGNGVVAAAGGRRRRSARRSTGSARALAGRVAERRAAPDDVRAAPRPPLARPRVRRPAPQPGDDRVKFRPARFFFLATVFCATFEKLNWNVAGSIEIADILAIGFIVSFALAGDRAPRPPLRPDGGDRRLLPAALPARLPGRLLHARVGPGGAAVLEGVHQVRASTSCSCCSA